MVVSVKRARSAAHRSCSGHVDATRVDVDMDMDVTSEFEGDMSKQWPKALAKLKRGRRGSPGEGADAAGQKLHLPQPRLGDGTVLIPRNSFRRPIPRAPATITPINSAKVISLGIATRREADARSERR